MRFLFDDELVESAVFLCATGKRPGIPSFQVRRFHREREKVYAILDPDERNAAFSRLHCAWFREWGLEKWLASVTANFPLLERSLRALAFRRARNKFEESAELYVNSSLERQGIVALRPERFEHEVPLAQFLHHELMHVSDMVEPAFGYSRDAGQFDQSASQPRVAQERYRLLWDVTIDGRLSRAGLATVASRAERQDEFDRAYSFLSPEKRSTLFKSLWKGKHPCHRDLMALASDPREANPSHAPRPGAPCPLCGFASFEWADGSALNEATVKVITRDFPTWTPGQGACFRCVEIYEASSGLELPATICG